MLLTVAKWWLNQEYCISRNLILKICLDYYFIIQHTDLIEVNVNVTFITFLYHIQKVVLAREAGICYSIIALATDYDCWREHGNKVCVEEVLTTFKKNVVKVSGLITSVIAAIGKENWDDTIKELRVKLLTAWVIK